MQVWNKSYSGGKLNQVGEELRLRYIRFLGLWIDKANSYVILDLVTSVLHLITLLYFFKQEFV